MFRFSIRDLLWLTLVVAMGLGWFVREHHLRAEADSLKMNAGAIAARAQKWRLRTGALEQVLGDVDWKVRWESYGPVVSALKQFPDGTAHEVGCGTEEHEPSIQDD